LQNAELSCIFSWCDDRRLSLYGETLACKSALGPPQAAPMLKVAMSVARSAKLIGYPDWLDSVYPFFALELSYEYFVQLP
jgi:hypothetical protein